MEVVADVEYWWWVTWIIRAVIPVVVVFVLWGNDLWYTTTLRARCLATGMKLPPGYMGIPYFGELATFIWYFKFLKRPDDFINSKRRRYGDNPEMYRTYLFGYPSIIAYTPDFLKFIFQMDDKFPYRWPTDLVGEHSLILAIGDEHKRLRRFVSVAINQPNALRQIALRIQPRIIASLKSWAETGTVVTYSEARKMTFENIGKLFASLEPGPVMDKLSIYFDGMLLGMRSNPLNFPGTAYYYARKCRKKLIAIFRGELEKKKKIKNNNKSTESTKEEEENDLMDGLMQLEDEDGRKLTDEEVLDNIGSLVLGGYESVATTLTWSIYYLAKYPDVLQKLREENSEFCKKKEGDFISWDDLSQLSYTNQVVEELVRLASVSGFIFRSGNEDVHYQGYKIPKGWKVICFLRYPHTDERNFEDPLCFNPNRWSQTSKPVGYFAYGGGRRSCAGNMLARMQITIFLHHLCIGNYKWELLNPDAEISYLPLPKPVDGVTISMSKI